MKPHWLIQAHVLLHAYWLLHWKLVSFFLRRQKVKFVNHMILITQSHIDHNYKLPLLISFSMIFPQIVLKIVLIIKNVFEDNNLMCLGPRETSRMRGTSAVG